MRIEEITDLAPWTALIADVNGDPAFADPNHPGQEEMTNKLRKSMEQQDEKIRFERIDADVTGSMKEEADEDQLKADTELLSGLFKKALSKEKLTVKVEKLKDAKISSMLTLNEEGRRMQDMMRMYSSGGMDMSMFAPEETLTLNQNNSLVKYLLAHKEGEHTDLFAKQLYDLAALANAPLQPEAMTAFIERSNEIMMLLAK